MAFGDRELSWLPIQTPTIAPSTQTSRSPLHKKTAIAPSTPKITIASPQKSNSDRPLNPKNHDRLNKNITIATSQKQTAIAPSTPKITIASTKNQTAIKSIYCVQSSICKLAICPKSEVLRVKTIALLIIAIAAIFKSIVPRRGYNFLMRWNSFAASISKSIIGIAQ